MLAQVQSTARGYPACRSSFLTVTEPIEELGGSVADPASLVAGDKIKSLREERGWSAQRLADECELAGAPSLTRSAIAKVEAGIRRLRTDEVVVLARVLGVPIHELLGAEPVAPPGAAGEGSPDRSSSQDLV